MTATVTEVPWLAPTERGFTSAEVMEITGVTYRQLDFWSRAGYLGRAAAQRVGSGHQRYFTADQVRVIYLTVALLRTGFIAMPQALQIARDLADGGRLDLTVGGVVRVRIEISGGE